MLLLMCNEKDFLKRKVGLFMKSEDLKKLKEIVKLSQDKKNEILELKKEIAELEKNTEVKKYLNLLDTLEEKKSKQNKEFENFSDSKLVAIALKKINITPDEEIYVYLGTYKYNDEIDVIHGLNDILVSRLNPKADYVRYQNLEAIYDGIIEVPYNQAAEFEETHKIIIPENVSRQRYFYELQSEYFETMILESPEKAMIKVNKLIKNNNANE